MGVATAVATPMKGKRLMNISGTEDKLVPYHGGPSKFIPANDGKLKFVAAEESIYLWAKEMGYMGEKKTRLFFSHVTHFLGPEVY